MGEKDDSEIFLEEIIQKLSRKIALEFLLVKRNTENFFQ